MRARPGPRIASSSCGPRSAATSPPSPPRPRPSPPAGAGARSRSTRPSPTSWRAHAVPSWVDRSLVVVPAWLEHRRRTDGAARRHRPGGGVRARRPPDDRPQPAPAAQAWWPGATVLDVGCGSGVLSVVAAGLGAPYVEAIDISTAAIEATVANAERNGVGRVVTASTRPLASIDEPFDLVLANLLAPSSSSWPPTCAGWSRRRAR